MNAFKKEERLCSRKSLDLLFKNGSSFLVYPYRVSYLLQPENKQAFPVQLVINVAKKRYKRAVDRNLIKRRTRECYRLNKQENLYRVLEVTPGSTLLSLQYVGKLIYDSSFLNKAINKVFKKLLAEIAAHESH